VNWRAARVGGLLSRRTVWRGRKNHWAIEVGPDGNGGWYFLAQCKNEAYNSLWEGGAWLTCLAAKESAEEWAKAQPAAARAGEGRTR